MLKPLLKWGGIVSPPSPAGEESQKPSQNKCFLAARAASLSVHCFLSPSVCVLSTGNLSSWKRLCLAQEKNEEFSCDFYFTSEIIYLCICVCCMCMYSYAVCVCAFVCVRARACTHAHNPPTCASIQFRRGGPQMSWSWS